MTTILACCFVGAVVRIRRERGRDATSLGATQKDFIAQCSVANRREYNAGHAALPLEVDPMHVETG